MVTERRGNQYLSGAIAGGPVQEAARAREIEAKITEMHRVAGRDHLATPEGIRQTFKKLGLDRIVSISPNKF